MRLLNNTDVVHCIRNKQDKGNTGKKMLNIIQQIFSPKTRETEQQHEIMNRIKSETIMHESYVAKSGAVVRRFLIINPDFTICAERSFLRSRPDYDQVHYTLRADNTDRVVYATHSTVDKFAKHVYKKLYRTWLKNKQKVK